MSHQSAGGSFVILARSRSRAEKKKELYRLALADLDMRSVSFACNEFMNLLDNWSQSHIPYAVSDAFIASMVICYSRPFTESRRGQIGRLKRTWGEFDNHTFQAAHDEMLRLRNEIFAHRDPAFNKMSIIPPLYKVADSEGTSPLASYTFHFQRIAPSVVETFRQTALNLQERLQERITTLLGELYAGMDLPRSPIPMRFDDGL
jgi:hypothetical protein